MGKQAETSKSFYDVDLEAFKKNLEGIEPRLKRHYMAMYLINRDINGNPLPVGRMMRECQSKSLKGDQRKECVGDPENCIYVIKFLDDYFHCYERQKI